MKGVCEPDKVIMYTKNLLFNDQLIEFASPMDACELYYIFVNKGKGKKEKEITCNFDLPKLDIQKLPHNHDFHRND